MGLPMFPAIRKALLATHCPMAFQGGISRGTLHAEYSGLHYLGPGSTQVGSQGQHVVALQGNKLSVK